MPELDVTWMLPDGAGGGRGPDGPVVVPGAVPGDRVAYRLVGRRGRTVHGALEAVLTPSPDRRAPPCPFRDACGGCDLDVLTPAAQRAAKAELVRHALRLEAPPPILPSPHPRGYRARIKLHLDGGQLGYRRAGSHDLVPIDTCGIAHPRLQAALPGLRAFIGEHGHAGLGTVELRTEGQRCVFAFESDGPVPRGLREALPALGDVALDGRRVAGDPALVLHVDGLALRASPRTFFQVNLDLNQELVARVVQAVADARPERILDLYAGNGNLSLPLARRTGAPVLAVEREGQATADLAANAEAAGLTLPVLTLPVERFDPSREPFDVVVLDPPRAGAPGVVGRLLRNRPRRIVYVACRPPSAARDLKIARKSGYRLRDVLALDLFPDTHHVEAVVVMERG